MNLFDCMCACEFLLFFFLFSVILFTFLKTYCLFLLLSLMVVVLLFTFFLSMKMLLVLLPILVRWWHLFLFLFFFYSFASLYISMLLVVTHWPTLTIFSWQVYNKTMFVCRLHTRVSFILYTVHVTLVTLCKHFSTLSTRLCCTLCHYVWRVKVERGRENTKKIYKVLCAITTKKI